MILNTIERSFIFNSSGCISSESLSVPKSLEILRSRELYKRSHLNDSVIKVQLHETDHAIVGSCLDIALGGGSKQNVFSKLKWHRYCKKEKYCIELDKMGKYI